MAGRGAVEGREASAGVAGGGEEAGGDDPRGGAGTPRRAVSTRLGALVRMAAGGAEAEGFRGDGGGVGTDPEEGVVAFSRFQAMGLAHEEIETPGASACGGDGEEASDEVRESGLGEILRDGQVPAGGGMEASVPPEDERVGRNAAIHVSGVFGEPGGAVLGHASQGSSAGCGVASGRDRVLYRAEWRVGENLAFEGRAEMEIVRECRKEKTARPVGMVGAG